MIEETTARLPALTLCSKRVVPPVLSLMLTGLALLGCSSTTSLPSPEPQQPASAPPPMTSFTTALQRRSPVEEISGNPHPTRYAGVETAPADPQASSQRFAEVITYSNSQNGTALVIWHQGKLLLEHYADSFDQSMRVESASMHKSVAGLLIAAAIADGDINSADDPVEDYIPAWRGEDRGSIRIRDLLTMSSGLAPLSREGGQDSPASRFGNGGPAARELVLAMDVAEPVGSHFHYMNTVTQLLCLILEQATGTRYADYLQRRLWQPLGAANAYVWNNEADGFPRTYMGLYARPRDWLRVGLLVLNNGRLANKVLVPAAQMAALTAPSPANSNYGWQIWRGGEHHNPRFYSDEKAGFSVITNEPFMLDDLLYFDGFGGQRVYISAAEQLVIVRFGEPSMTFDDSKIPNEVVRVLAVGAPPTADISGLGSD